MDRSGLPAVDNQLTRDAISERLTTRLMGRNLEVHREIDSTNSRATALARDGAAEGTLVLSEMQTAGRGRLGRRWFAPPGTALLMSLILRPSLRPQQAQRATMLCSLAVVEAISRVTGLVAQLKWPNDIVVNGAKLGGILTELGVSQKRLDHVIVGIGLNVNVRIDALPELMSPATSLLEALGEPVSRLELLVAILGSVERRYACLREHPRWDARSR